MKITRKLTCALLALLLCIVMVVPVAALSNSDPAGIYGTVRGTASSSGIESGLRTLTTVVQNPDNAYLITTVEFSNGAYSFGTFDARSGRSVSRFSYTFPVPLLGETPDYVYTCHEVRGGATSPVGYATRCQGSMDFS